MKYRLTPEAEQDLRKIWSYTWDAWGRAKANDYLQQMKATFERLCGYPELGKRRDDVRVNYRSIPHIQHVVFYRIGEQYIEIVRVLHQRMDVDGAFGDGE